MILSDPHSGLNLIKQVLALLAGVAIMGLLILLFVSFNHLDFSDIILDLPEMAEIGFLVLLSLFLVVYGLRRTFSHKKQVLTVSKDRISGRFEFPRKKPGEQSLLYILFRSLIKPVYQEVNLPLAEIRDIRINVLDITILLKNTKEVVIPLNSQAFKNTQQIKDLFREWPQKGGLSWDG